MRSLLRLSLALLSSLAVATACTSRETNSARALSAGVGGADDSLVGVTHVTGEFLTDGSCRVTVNGAAVFSAGETPRTISLAGRTVNMAPAGHDIHELWCSPGDTLDPMIPDQPGDRALLIMLYPRSGVGPSAGPYSIVRDVPTRAGPTTETSASLSLFDPAHVQQGDHAGVAYLAADSGSVTLTRVDGARVVGTFTVRATRAWTM